MCLTTAPLLSYFEFGLNVNCPASTLTFSEKICVPIVCGWITEWGSVLPQKGRKSKSPIFLSIVQAREDGKSKWTLNVQHGGKRFNEPANNKIKTYMDEPNNAAGEEAAAEANGVVASQTRQDDNRRPQPRRPPPTARQNCWNANRRVPSRSLGDCPLAGSFRHSRSRNLRGRKKKKKKNFNRRSSTEI